MSHSNCSKTYIKASLHSQKIELEFINSYIALPICLSVLQPLQNLDLINFQASLNQIPLSTWVDFWEEEVVVTGEVDYLEGESTSRE